MSRRTLFLVIFTFALLVRSAHLISIWNHPYYEMGGSWPNSDMYQYQKWAEHLAEGDWLDRNTYRAWFEWQEIIAPREIWNSWYGTNTYYQSPLYAYVVAVVLKLTGSLDAYRIFQMGLGAVNCGLIAVLGAALFGTPAGWIAGIGSALFAPFIMYDLELLRGTVGITLQLLGLYSLRRWYGTEARKDRLRRAFLAGVVLGVGYLADPAVALFMPLAFVWMVWGGWFRYRDANLKEWLRDPILLAGGVIVALLPLMGRNLAVGAPLLSSSTRGPLAFVMGNSIDAEPAGATVPPTTRLILFNSGYTMSGTIRETLKFYDGNYASLLVKQLIKLRALLGSYEIPDNPNFYYVAHVSPVVRWGLRFLPVAALGLVGLGLSLARARGEPLHALLPLFLVSFFSLFLIAHVVSRYRQPMLIALFPLAGYAVTWAVARGWNQRIGVGVAALAVFLILPWSPPPGYGYHRPAEYIVAARMLREADEPERALAELDAAMQHVLEEETYRPTLPILYYEKGTVKARAGLHAEAIELYRAALELDPKLEVAHIGLSESRDALGLQPDPLP